MVQGTVLYLADKFCPLMSAHYLLMFVSLMFLWTKVNKLWSLFQGCVFLTELFWNLHFKYFGTNLAAQVAQFGRTEGRIDGAGM